MKVRKYILPLFLLPLMAWSGCKKDDEPIMDPVPYLRIDSVSASTVKQYEENLRVFLYYEDGDGNLGFPNPDSVAIYVQDSRLDEPDPYHLPPLSPTDQELPIQGTIEVELKSPFLLGNGGNEVINYSIRLRDRSGNWSNTEITPDITITP